MNAQLSILKNKYRSNSKLIKNIIAAFAIKGTGLLVSIIGLPLYINYFDDKTALGVWFTLLTLVGWILSFDIGVGNGLRNKLTIALANKDYEEGKRLISSAYCVMGALTLLLAFIVVIICTQVNWNSLLNIDTSVIDRDTLSHCIATIFIGILGTFFFQIVRGQLYALQLSSINNLLHMSTNLFMVAILFFLPSEGSMADKFTLLSISYAIIINLPNMLATFFVHKFSELKNCRPSYKYVSKTAIKDVLGLGIMFFIIQLLHMFISVSNEFFITICFNPKYCVDYQVYFRFFSLLGTLIMLALTPLWSAITKAYAEKRYIWIYKLNKFLSLIAVGAVGVQCLMLLILQPLINVWLRDKAIEVDYLTATLFLMYSVELIWVSVQSTMVAGMGKLKTQLIFYSIAVVIKITIILIVAKFNTDAWMYVVLATVLGLLPYCVIQPINVSKMLNDLQKK